MTNIQDLMKQLHASLVPNKLEAAIKAELESLQAEVIRLKRVSELALNQTRVAALLERDGALAQVATMKTQKPCAAISRCSLNGATDCSCDVNGSCGELIDVYLAAGAAEALSVREDGMPTSKTERHLRRLLCAQRHGARAYMDDGEASWGGGDHHRQIDYMRETPEAIELAWREAGYKELSEQLKQGQLFVMETTPLPIVQSSQERYLLTQPEGSSKPYVVKHPDGNWTPVNGVTQSGS